MNTNEIVTQLRTDSDRLKRAADMLSQAAVLLSYPNEQPYGSVIEKRLKDIFNGKAKRLKNIAKDLGVSLEQAKNVMEQERDEFEHIGRGWWKPVEESK